MLFIVLKKEGTLKTNWITDNPFLF